MNEKEPQIVYVRKTDREIYDRLMEKDSPFSMSEIKTKHLFMLAMAIGVYERKKTGIKEGERDGAGFFRTEYLSDREKSLIKAIAIADTGGFEVLLDKKKVYAIAQEYAAGGIVSLKEQALSGGIGSYSNRLEVELLEILHGMQIGAKENAV